MDGKNLKTVEKSRKWERVSGIKIGRAAATSFVHKNRVFVAGGSSEVLDLNEERLEWDELATTLPYLCALELAITLPYPCVLELAIIYLTLSLCTHCLGCLSEPCNSFLHKCLTGMRNQIFV